MTKNWSGERLETFVYRDTSVEHLHRYAFALGYIQNKRVLDIACGSGYGSNIISPSANYVFGVDIDEQTVLKARNTYQNNNLEFLIGSTSNIPLKDNSVDVVISFETIEHHDEHEKMMEEIKRVLTKDGLLIISSPEKMEYSDKRNYKNPFHVKELYEEEFKSFIKRYFIHSEFFDQNSIKGSMIIPQKGINEFSVFSGNFNGVQKDLIPAKFLIAVASDNELFRDNVFSFFNGQELLLKEQMKNQQEISEKINLSIEMVRKSWRYKIGSMILFPIEMFKRMLK